LELARRVSARCFKAGLVIETTGRSDAVLKFLPPLTIDDQTLHDGFAIFEQALKECLDG
jgi:diaminobutyrate-2-oxoglutarate transaminase